MKQSFKILIKGLLVIVLFTGSSIALSTGGVKTVNEADAAISTQQVWNYLVNHGYTVYSVNPISGTNNFICSTQLQGINYWTTVYTDGVNKVIQIESVPA